MVRWFSGFDFDEPALAIGLIAIVVFLLSGQITSLYRGTFSGSANAEILSVVGNWAITLMGLSIFAFITRYDDRISRTVIFGWVLLAPTTIGLVRMSLRLVQHGLLRRGFATRRIAIAGLTKLGIQVSDNISDDPSLGMEMAGFFDDRELSRFDNDDANHELVGGLGRMVELARQGEFDAVFITLPMRAETRIRRLLDELSDTTASVYIVPDFFVFELLHSRWTNMGGIPAVSVFENPLFGVDGLLKRIADVSLALLALIVSAIPMLVIATLVKLTSRGPIFFRQTRYGLDGREIEVWKFRSMTTCDNGPVVKQATKNDPRITRVGQLLRRTSLDELPQLFNVLDGSMSLVGPRPHASAHNEQYRSLIRGYMLRHKVKPGITGLAQVNGCRGETDTIDKMEKRVDWDHKYIRSWSLWLDLKILLKTLKVVWGQPEAY